MAIRYEPSKILKRIAPAKKIERLVSGRLSLNKAALNTLADTGFLSKRKLTTVTLKVIKQYKERYAVEREAGLSAAAALEETLAEKALLVQRVQNAAMFELTKEVKDQYDGETYTWLPSEANEPDPLHQLNYGLTFTIGAQEDPGERYGCQCGMLIHVDEENLELT